MRRREFIAITASAALWPLAGFAQGDRTRRIGVLMTLTKDNAEGQARLAALIEGLDELGWKRGHNIQIDDRWPGDDAERLRTDAAELIGSNSDVIVAGGSRTLSALQQQTKTVPIVFVAAAGTTEHGFVKSASRPAGNLTGYTTFDSFALVGKLLGVLKEVAPEITRALLIMYPGHPSLSGYQQELVISGPALGVVPSVENASTAADLERIVSAFAREPKGALLLPADQFNIQHRDLIIALAAQYRLPAVYAYRGHVVAGGLMSYGIDFSALYRLAASYVDRILRGAQPADLPVQSPTKYVLTINLNTAKALGLDAPPTLLARADVVIE